MTPSRLSVIRARLDAATPGQWSRSHGTYIKTDHGAWQNIAKCDGKSIAQMVADAELIANAPTDLRALLDEVERLKNDLAMARQVSGELCEACGWAMKFPGEPCRCEMVKWCDEWEAFKARMTEQDASSFRRGAEAMQDELAGWADRAYAKALTSDAIRMLPHASSEPDLDLTGDRAFDAQQPSLGTPVPPERRIRRQADVDAAFARGAEAMRTALLQRLSWGSDLADRIRDEPVPEDR